MQDSLTFFKDIIEKNALLIIRHEFVKNPSYDTEDDSILAIGNNPFSDQVVEYRLTFGNYLKQLLALERQRSFKVLGDNLHSIIPAKDKEDYLSTLEDELNFLLFKLQSSSESWVDTVSAELSTIQSYIKERYKNEVSSSLHEKLKWQASPELFFILFQELYASEFLSNTPSRRSLLKVSSLLYEAFDIKPNIKDKEQYTENAFYQNLKSTGLLQEDPKNEHIKVLVQEFIASLKRL